MNCLLRKKCLNSFYLLLIKWINHCVAVYLYFGKKIFFLLLKLLFMLNVSQTVFHTNMLLKLCVYFYADPSFVLLNYSYNGANKTKLIISQLQ